MPLRGVSKEDTSSLANLWLLSFRKESNRGCGLRKPAMWFAGTLLQKHCGRGVRKPTMWFAGTLLQKYCGRRLRKPAIVFAKVRRRSSAPSYACADKRNCLTKCADAGLGTFLKKGKEKTEAGSASVFIKSDSITEHQQQTCV